MAKKKEIKATAVVAKSNQLIANCDNQSFEVQNMHLKQQDIENLIYVIRGTQVMLDSDLAMLYGVETKALNQAVKRNINRFPDDFMFQLSQEEAIGSRSQIVTLNREETISRSQIVTLNEELTESRSQNATLKSKESLSA